MYLYTFMYSYLGVRILIDALYLLILSKEV